jgi:hypothetical protein
MILPSTDFAQVLSSKDEISTPLFVCETNRQGKFIAIRGIEEEPARRWSAIQYSFGRGDEEPEMVYPLDPTNGATSMFFSHTNIHFRYQVSIRFSTGDYTYRVFSYDDGMDAGVMVSDRRGKIISRISCIERPYMFAAYLQRALACDRENPYGKAACGDKPYQPKSDQWLLGKKPSKPKTRK